MKVKLGNLLRKSRYYSDLVTAIVKLETSAEECGDAGLHASTRHLVSLIVALASDEVDIDSEIEGIVKGLESARTEKMVSYEEVFGEDEGEEGVDSN